MATAEVDRRYRMKSFCSDSCDSRPVSLLCFINSSRSPLAIAATPSLFCPEDYLFESHGIIMGLDMLPRHLLESDFHQLYNDINSSKEFKNALPPVKAVRLVEQLLPLAAEPPTLYGAIYVITTNSKVKCTQELLRCYYYHPHKLVGNLPDDQWMIKRLNIIVTTPERVLALHSSGTLSRRSVTALVLVEDPSHEFFTQVLEVLDVLECFYKIVSSRSPPRFAYLKWLKTSTYVYGQMNDEFRYALEQNLPEAVSCPGLLDSHFFHTVDLFAVCKRNVVSQDSSAMLTFMPGLIPGDGSNPSLIVAPQEWAPRLAEVLRVFLDRLGLFQVQVVCLCGKKPRGEVGGFCIVVGTPDRILQQMIKPGKAVVVEADVLVSSGLKPEVEEVLSRGAEDMKVGIHSVELTPDVEDLITRFCKGDFPTSRIPKAVIGVDGVEHLYTVAGEGKMEKLSQVCMHWREIFMQKAWRVIAVYCSSERRVKMVRSEMESLMASWSRWCPRFTLAATHTEMEAGMVEAVEQELPRGWVLLFTNIYSRRWGDVISLDMPESKEEYFRLAAEDRMKNLKRVISICSEEEVPRLEEWGKALGFEAKLLPPPTPRILNPYRSRKN